MADEPEITSRRLSARQIGLGVAVVILVAFMLSNLDDTNVGFLWFDSDVSLAMALAVAALVGLVAGYLAGRQASRRGRRS